MLKSHAFVLAAGAALIALDASASLAQDTSHARPRSTKRITVKKEAGGEVAPMPAKVDTVTVFKTDTLQLQGRIDTVTVTNTVTRTDTLTQVQTITKPIPQVGGLYFGLAGGTSLPYGGLRDVNNDAATGQFQVGWQPLATVLGIRGDVQYSRYSLAQPFSALGDRPNVWNANLDLKLQIPGVEDAFGHAVRFAPYLIGGGSYIRYSNLRMQTEDGLVTSDVSTNFDDNSHGNWGWNAGGGLGWHFANKELFIESRLIQFNRGTALNGSNYMAARQVPIVFGMNIY
jgi:opacity protein-like surface antigen